jgi:hypothetical protein
LIMIYNKDIFESENKGERKDGTTTVLDGIRPRFRSSVSTPTRHTKFHE